MIFYTILTYCPTAHLIRGNGETTETRTFACQRCACVCVLLFIVRLHCATLPVCARVLSEHSICLCCPDFSSNQSMLTGCTSFVLAAGRYPWQCTEQVKLRKGCLFGGKHPQQVGCRRRQPRPHCMLVAVMGRTKSQA